MSQNIGIGIIGYGFMGQCHAKMISAVEGFELKAVCDIDKSRLEDVKKDSTLKVYETAEELCNDSDVHTVIISAPNIEHSNIVKIAARKGKAIICEKPVTLNVAEFDEMMEVVNETGVPFTIHQQRRWDKDCQITKSVYDSKTLGEAYTLKSYIYGVNGNMHDWHIYKSQGGGMLLDWGVHLIDQILYIVDSPVKTVFADVRNVINEEVDDYFKIDLLFENGLSAQIELGTYYLKPNRGWDLCGDKGSMFIENYECDGNIIRTRHLLKNVPGSITMTAAGPTRSFGPPAEGVLYSEKLPEVIHGHQMFFENYRDTILGKSEFWVKPEEVRRVMALIETIRQSSCEGKSLSFE